MHEIGGGFRYQGVSGTGSWGLGDFTNEGSWLTLVVHGVKKIFHEAGSYGDVGDIGRCIMCLTGGIRVCLTDVKDTDVP